MAGEEAKPKWNRIYTKQNTFLHANTQRILNNMKQKQEKHTNIHAIVLLKHFAISTNLMLLLFVNNDETYNNNNNNDSGKAVYLNKQNRK